MKHISLFRMMKGLLLLWPVAMAVALSTSSTISSEHDPQSALKQLMIMPISSNLAKNLLNVSIWWKRTLVLPSLFSMPTIKSPMAATPER